MSSDDRATATEMIAETNREASRIRQVQRVLLKSAIIKTPNAEQDRRAQVFEQTSEFIARLTPYADDIRAMLKEQPGRIARFMGSRNG